MPLSTGKKIYIGLVIGSFLICFGCIIGILQINSKYGNVNRPPSIQKLYISLVLIGFIFAIFLFSLIFIPVHDSSNNGPGVGTHVAQTGVMSFS